MRNLILIVILHLIIKIAETEDDFTFGDIIAFERRCFCKTFNHYAVYVGKEEFYGKKLKHNIFHRTGLVLRLCPKPSLSDCIFGELNTAHKYKKFNYLDKLPNFKAGSKAEITERIQEKHGNCGTYRPQENNCEHLATYVRYGVKLSLQFGTDAAPYCRNNNKFNIPEIRKMLGSIYNPEESCESLCSRDSSCASD